MGAWRLQARARGRGAAPGSCPTRHSRHRNKKQDRRVYLSQEHDHGEPLCVQDEARVVQVCGDASNQVVRIGVGHVA